MSTAAATPRRPRRCSTPTTRRPGTTARWSPAWHGAVGSAATTAGQATGARRTTLRPRHWWRPSRTWWPRWVGCTGSHGPAPPTTSGRIWDRCWSSTVRPSMSGPDAEPVPTALPVEVDVLPLGSIAGGSTGGPWWWSQVADKLEGFVWPDADTDDLRSLAGHWRDAALAVERLPAFVGHASTLLGRQVSPEIPMAVAALDQLTAGIATVAAFVSRPRRRVRSTRGGRRPPPRGSAAGRRRDPRRVRCHPDARSRARGLHRRRVRGGGASGSDAADRQRCQEDPVVPRDAVADLGHSARAYPGGRDHRGEGAAGHCA